MKKLIFLVLMFCLSFTASVYANSLPVIMEEEPGFAVAPVNDTPIIVSKEKLRFVVDHANPRKAAVTAGYTMENPTGEAVTQPMMFPFLTSGELTGFAQRVKITANGRPVQFITRRLDDINTELMKELSVTNILSMINRPDFVPSNFKLTQKVKVYTLHILPQENERQAEILFKIDPKKHRLLYDKFNVLSFNNDSSGKLSVLIPPVTADPEKGNAHIVVFGEDAANPAQIKSLTGDKITIEEKTMSEFLHDDFIRENLPDNFKITEMDGIFNYAVKQLDSLMAGSQPFMNFGDIIGSYVTKTYLGALLYKVDFQPKSSVTLTVEYDMMATIDRSKTKEYSNMFMYLLKPAAAWADFKNLYIEIMPSKKQPFIIESSLPLVKNAETGNYTASFDRLPDKDFYFTTYKTERPDPSLSQVVRRLFNFVPVWGIAVGVAVIILGGYYRAYHRNA